MGTCIFNTVIISMTMSFIISIDNFFLIQYFPPKKELAPFFLIFPPKVPGNILSSFVQIFSWRAERNHWGKFYPCQRIPFLKQEAHRPWRSPEYHSQYTDLWGSLKFAFKVNSSHSVQKCIDIPTSTWKDFEVHRPVCA